MMKIFLNDRFVDKEAALISVFDHGFMYGDGVFETLVSYNGKVFKAGEHMDRLFRSADMLMISISMTKDELIGLLGEAIRVNNLTNAYLRVSITRGVGEIGLSPSLCAKPTFVIYSHERRPQPDIFYDKGVAVALVSVTRNSRTALNPLIKTTSFLNNILAKIEAQKLSAFEGIMLNQDGFLAEGTISNVFFIREGVLFTPSLETGILDGITREVVIEIAGSRNLNVREGLYLPEDLHKAAEIFLTSTSMEIVPVVSVAGRPVGSGLPGPVTRDLARAYKSHVRDCLALDQ